MHKRDCHKEVVGARLKTGCESNVTSKSTQVAFISVWQLRAVRGRRMRALVCLVGISLVGAQWLPDVRSQSFESHMAPTYEGERCAFYDVHRVRPSSAPRLGELSPRPASLPNLTICDGYGVKRKHVRVPCQGRCPADPFAQDVWSVLLCAPLPLVPLVPPPSGVPGTISLLLVSSDHNNHGLFAQVERVLNQLHAAETLGLLPYVYLGRKVAAAPDSCEVGENQYFSPAHGSNVWEYYFEQVSSYSLGAPTLNGRPVRLLLAAAEDVRRFVIRTSRDAVTSYFEFGRYDAALHEIRTRVRRMGARLVRQWVRVKPDIVSHVHAALVGWRRRSTHLLGVHLRGTDKVTHPKIPMSKFVGYIDKYLAAHPGALIVLATDDATYHAELRRRYSRQGRVRLGRLTLTLTLPLPLTQVQPPGRVRLGRLSDGEHCARPGHLLPSFLPSFLRCFLAGH